jgi:hypothetical protein
MERRRRGGLGAKSLRTSLLETKMESWLAYIGQGSARHALFIDLPWLLIADIAINVSPISIITASW